MSKELWFTQMERRMAELIDQGVSEDAAYDRASKEADSLVLEQLADMADYARKRAKEGQ